MKHYIVLCMFFAVFAYVACEWISLEPTPLDQIGDPEDATPVLYNLSNDCILYRDSFKIEQCKKANKDRLCTCRKLAKFIQPMIGKKLGPFLPACKRGKRRLFAKKQCYYPEARCWCVYEKSGKLKKGTMVQGPEIEKLKCK